MAIAIVALTILIAGTPARAQTPWWHVTSRPSPTDLIAGAEGKVSVVADNVGDESARGRIVLRDRLPDGVKASRVSFYASFFGLGGAFDLGPNGALGPLHLCNVSSGEVLCAFPDVGELEKIAPVFIAEQFSPPATPYFGRLEMAITVQVSEGAQPEEENEVSVTGGEAPAVEMKKSMKVGDESTAFGLEEFTLVPEEEGGSIDSRAGSHPFQLTTDLAFNQTAQAPYQPAQPKDVRLNAPPGLLGNPTVVPQCTYVQFTTQAAHGSNLCPAESAVGVVAVVMVNGASKSTFVAPLFNITPASGEPARFGFDAETVPVVLDASVRTGDDYGVTIGPHNISQLIGIVSAQITIWGVPGDPRHDASRGWECLGMFGTCPSDSGHPTPFLVLPTACSTDFQATAEVDSWAHPGEFLEPMPYTLHDQTNPAIKMDACGDLPFSPEVSVVPDAAQASVPTGLEVDVHTPQGASSNPDGLAESALEDTTIALPAGIAVNPGGADGLEACTEAEVGYLASKSAPPGDLHFTSEVPSCPDASKIGTVEVKTPLLANQLEGAVYLATQNANPFGALFAMYVIAEDQVSGTRLKLPGEVSLDPGTGELTSTFMKTPELPFEDLRLHFFGGPRAPLGTPAMCGAYVADASLAPWSGSDAVSVSSTFDITSGPKGSPCPSSLPFAPTLTAGMTNGQAGGFSPMTMTLSREDGNQDLRSVRVRMPPGVSAIVSSVHLCTDQQAEAGTCGQESLIGHATVSAGLGEDPFNVTGGEVFLTGPYDGAPYGLSIVDPAKAGPFDLGTVIVRAKIEVDPTTAALTVTTDPSGPHAIPRILDGVPLQIKHVNLTIDRSGFTFNPTNCNKLAVDGSLMSDLGVSVSLSVPFQVANCATLGFKPQFKVSVSSKTSRKNGADVG